MALTRDFRLTVAARAQRDPKFRQALFTEVIRAYFAGDARTGKALQKKCRMRLGVMADLG